MKTNFVKFIVPTVLFGAMLAPIAARADEPEHHGQINARLHRQHTRIEQGERSGRLSEREANRLERRDARIHRQASRFHRHGHARLTMGERRHLRHELNRTSAAIYREKHDHDNR